MEEIDALYNLGATEVIAEEFETSLEILGRVLFHLFVPANQIEQQIAEVRGSSHERIAAFLSRTKAEIVTVAVGTLAAGKTLAELSLRSRTGASVIAVLRGEDSSPNPPPSFLLEEGDWAVLLGTAHEVESAEGVLAAALEPESPPDAQPLAGAK